MTDSEFLLYSSPFLLGFLLQLLFSCVLAHFNIVDDKAITNLMVLVVAVMTMMASSAAGNRDADTQFKRLHFYALRSFFVKLYQNVLFMSLM